MIYIYSFPLLPPGYDGFSFFIFIFFRSARPSARLINHERIHFFQQLELLFVLHWLIYLLHYLIMFFHALYKHRKPLHELHDMAYRSICFEREAYMHEGDPDYLKNRRFYAWISYFGLPGNQSS